MPRFANINGIDVQFTPEEEIKRDEEERLEDSKTIAAKEKADQIAELEAKLADDSLTFNEMKDLMRLKGN